MTLEAEDVFEDYVRYAKCEEDEDDDDTLIYSRVEVIKDMSDKGPKAGEKYLRVDLHCLGGEAVFRLKNGGCRTVMLSLKKGKPNKWMGEFKPPKSKHESDDDGETHLPGEDALKRKRRPRNPAAADSSKTV